MSDDVKKSNWLRIVLVFLILAAASGLVWAALLWSSTLDGPFEEKRLTAVTSRLRETTPQAIVSTAEGLYNFVFPFDFVGAEGAWQRILKTRLGQFYSGRLSPQSEEEKRLVELLRSFRALGLSFKDGKKFIVLQVRIKYGFDFKQGELRGRWETRPSGRLLVVTLPALEVTDFIVVDGASGKNGFPEVEVSPSQWKALVDVLKPAILQMVEERGLREEAHKNALALFEALLASVLKEPFRLVVP